MTEEFEELLALQIARHEKFANAYQLCKVLAWVFKIINCSEIINRISKKNYVIITFNESKTLKYFALDERGMEILKAKKSELANVLRTEYPLESEFIDLLLKADNNDMIA